MKNTKFFRFCLMLAAMFVAVSVSAQTQYKGTVVDEAGDPVIGATVIVKETTIGTTTGIDGDFTIAVPKDGVVQISFIGYITEVISNLSQTQIVLREDKQQIEEVVVIGYGVQKKAHLTGSVGTVQMDEIQDLAGGDLGSALSGMINGVSVSGGDQTPGSRATIYIRDASGVGSVTQHAQEPLYVIDGYIYPNDVTAGNGAKNLGAEAFSNLDPSVIESISVLKDASAAVYGARAANGVVLVTTKRGKQGAPQVSYNGTFGIADAISMPKMLNAYQYGRVWNIKQTADPTTLNQIDRTTDLFQADELNAMKGLNYDLLDKYWKAAFKQKHSFNIAGATEKANYFAGISYFDQDGNIGTMNYNRWNYRAGIDVKITDWLKAGLSVSGDYGKTGTPKLSIGGITNADTQYRALLLRPRYIPEYVNGLPIAAYGVDNEGSGDQHYHYQTVQNNGDYSSSMDSNLNIQANVDINFDWWKPLKGLTARFSYGKSISTDKTNQFNSEYTLYSMIERAGSGRHLYTPVPGQEAAYEELMNMDNFSTVRVVNGGTSRLYRSMTRTDNYQMNFQLNYARTFGKHSVGGTFAIEKSETEAEYLEGYKFDPYEFSTGQSTSATGDMNTVFTRNVAGSLSYLGRLNYAYDDKYLLEFVLRVDSSTKFAPENYWGYFPSVSAGWVVSKESWFADNVKWVDFLKLRASFGLTGRDNLEAWQWMQSYDMDPKKGLTFGTALNGFVNNLITISNSTAAINRDVHWDKSYKLNVGIDWNILNNRLGFTFDGYYEMNREMLINLSQNVPGTVGSRSAPYNLGEMDSYGVEFSATWRDRIGKDFKYRIGINTGYSDNKVKVADFQIKDTDYYKSVQPGGRTNVGTWGYQCIGMFRSFQDIEEYFAKYGITSYMGLTKDAVRPGMLIYKDIRGAFDLDSKTYAGPDGSIDEKDMVRLSNRGNLYGFTLNLGADYKNFSLTAQIKASWGGYNVINNMALRAYTSDNDLERYNLPSFWNPDNMFAYENVYDGSGQLVVAENRDARYPNIAHSRVNAQPSSFWRVSAASVTLDRLTLAYTLPKHWLQAVGISSVRLNVTGQNLFSFYNPMPDKFYDPYAGGYASYPKMRNFTIGVNVTF